MQELKATTHADLFGKGYVHVITRPDGSTLLTAVEPLKPYARCVTEHLRHWALKAPHRDFMLERGGDRLTQALL